MIKITNEVQFGCGMTLTITISDESEDLLHAVEVAVLQAMAEHKRKEGVA